VLELQGKVGSVDLPALSPAAGTAEHATAREALVELGWSLVDAEQALAGIDPELPAEERVRQALRSAA
jgi:Holliday junction resolvasome RuvABC DNA-binding subunit